MEQLFIYLLKSSALIALFFLAYHFLVRKETFFNTNRWFLLSGLLTSVTLPLYFFKKIIWIETPKNTLQNLVITSPKQSFALQNTPIVEALDWMQLIWISYGIIAAILVIKILLNLVSLYRMLRRKQVTKKEELKLVKLNENITPFSFFNYIVYNPDLYSNDELQSILLHEQIHSKQKHSVDVLIAELFCAAFWFNPFIWFYKKAITQNLEYIADQKAIAQLEDKKSYQHALLKVVSNQNCLPITNNFYQSLIKKRIVMLNKNQSQKTSSWKYFIIVPTLATFMFLFQIETVAQVKESQVQLNEKAFSTALSSTVTKNTTDTELKELEKTFTDQYKKLIVSNVKRNKNKEIIGIKLIFDSGKTHKRVYADESMTPIDDIKVFTVTNKNDELTFGFTKAKNDTPAPLTSVKIEGEISKGGSSQNPNEYWTYESMTKDGKEVILIINGKVQSGTEKHKIPFNEDLEKMVVITASEFEKKYNQKAIKNKFYYEISTIKSDKLTGDKNKQTEQINISEEISRNQEKSIKPIIFSNDNGDDIVFIPSEKSLKVPSYPSVKITENSPILIINGEEKSNPSATLNLIDLQKVKSIRVYDANNKETKGTEIKKVVIITK